MVMMRSNYFLDNIMREVASKYNIPFTVVQECMASQYEFIRKSIESFDAKTQTGPRVIYIPVFGKFIISDKTIETLKERYKDYKEEENE